VWFYQRGQSSEIYQVIFFSGLFISLMGFLRPLSQRGPSGLDAAAWRCLALAWIWIALLVLTRLLYGLLLPIVVLLALWCAARGRPLRDLRASGVKLGAALLLPPLIIVALLGGINYAKFGAPWLSGYHQWLAANAWPVARFADGLWSYLFSPRYSIFFFFPPLVFALLGWRRFSKCYRLDVIVMLSLSVPFFLYFCKIPMSDWGYGPRYLLPMLPILSLPFLSFADYVIDNFGTWRARAWAVAAFACLGYSAYLQVQVNLMPFWAYYNAREALFVSRSLEAIDYFLYRHPAFIAEDLVRHRHDVDGLPYFAEVKRYAPPEFVAEYRDKFGAMLERGNLYWALPPAERR
jgi:4-amino-4-deoxy-L-arabinose transferase-like glycosyltransferase